MMIDAVGAILLWLIDFFLLEQKKRGESVLADAGVFMPMRDGCQCALSFK
jgi:hypothetical protein